MPELEYFLVAESYSVDRDRNQLSIFNVLTDIRDLDYPYQFPKMVVIACWISSDQEIEEKLDFQESVLVTVGDAEPNTYHFNFECDSEYQHLVIGIEELTITEPTLVTFELRLNNDYKAKHRIRFV